MAMGSAPDDAAAQWRTLVAAPLRDPVRDALRATALVSGVDANWVWRRPDACGGCLRRGGDAALAEEAEDAPSEDAEGEAEEEEELAHFPGSTAAERPGRAGRTLRLCAFSGADLPRGRSYVVVTVSRGCDGEPGEPGEPGERRVASGAPRAATSRPVWDLCATEEVPAGEETVVRFEVL